MNRFAALLDLRQSRAESALRIAADLARRTRSDPDRLETGGICLWQGGAQPVVQTLGPLSLAGDLALTDLPELRGALAADSATGAADLVLKAWEKWGESALDRLNGSFAFVIQDARSRRLTAVRDRFGVQPLCYAITPWGWVVASDLSTVLASLDAAPDVNPAWVAEYLSGQPVDCAATAHSGIFRLPAGHLMVLTPDGAPDNAQDLRSWYRLESAPPPTSISASGSALRAALAHATAQACADSSTATMLSGGLDSSSLALLSVADDDSKSVSARPALSLRYQDPAMDEGRHIQDVLHQSAGRLDPVFLAGESADDSIFRLPHQLDWQDQPIFAPGLNRNHMLYRAARELGCGAILDGHGGDEIIGGTFHDIALLAQGQGWPRALGLATRYARFTGTSAAEVIGYLLAVNGRHGFGRLGRKILKMSQTPGQIPEHHLVDPELARATRLAERLHDLDRPDPRDRDLPEGVRHHARMIAGPRNALAFEVLGRAAQSEGMAPRYPFYDHRVAELTIWQPLTAKIAQGRPRALLREAMRGVLPESVRLRSDKTNFLSGFWTALRQDPEGRFAALAADAGPLRDWANPATLRADVARLSQSPEADPQTAFRLWRALNLAVWLERDTPTAARPRPLPVLTSA